MIKRKMIILFMILYLIVTLSFFAYASLLSPFISKLAPAAALATGSGGGFTIPAKVLANTSSGANVASWISLAVPGTTAAKVTIAVLGIAGALASEYIMEKANEWFTANNLSKNSSTGNIEEELTNNYVPNGYTPGDYLGYNGATNINNAYGVGLYANLSAADAALAVHKADSACPGAGVAHTSKAFKGAKAFYYYCGGIGYAFYYPVTAVHSEKYKVPLTPGQLESKLASDLANENAAAKDVAKAALEVTANAMDNPDHPVTKNTTTYNNINNYLTANITTNQLTNLEAAATPNVGDQVLPDADAEKVEALTAAQIAAAVAAALANQGLSASQIAAAIAAAQSAATGGLTQAELASTLSSEGLTAAQIAAAIAAANPAITQTQVKTAVKEAIDDETGITPPVDPVISLPDKLSLTTILNDFWTSVQALPIFNVLNGITITTSGSSNLCIDLPADYGGQRCYNAANVQDELNMIGSVILGLTTVVSFIGIFKG